VAGAGRDALEIGWPEPGDDALEIGWPEPGDDALEIEQKR
jgi:hypothetical protein